MTTTSAQPAPSVSGDEAGAFLHDFRSMSTFGATPGGGVDRQAGTFVDGQTRTWFRGLVEGHGFDVRYDAVGNQFALLELAPDLRDDGFEAAFEVVHRARGMGLRLLA